MHLVSFGKEKEQLGILIDGKVYLLNDLNPELPHSVMPMLDSWDRMFLIAKAAIKKFKSGIYKGIPVGEAALLSPVPHPRSCRDGYAFRQHVETARRNRGVPMIPEFDQYPVFYFTNHQAIHGPGIIHCMPDHFRQLDFELEVAIVIGKRGRNIRAAEADNYIAGYTIMNDLSARQLQMEEMLLNLGPAKGKDFSTVLGPTLVTPDDLEPFIIKTKEGHTGKQYNLKMKCEVNGITVSEGNLSQMDWTFAELIERASYGVDLFPGDVIGSGTVGTGCFLELNGTAKLNNPSHVPQWLQDGDVISLTIDQLGTLTNVIKKENTDWSILNQKKNLNA